MGVDGSVLPSALRSRTCEGKCRWVRATTRSLAGRAPRHDRGDMPIDILLRLKAEESSHSPASQEASS